ncbi:MAG: acyl carrier protein [Acidobacteria bacterium]|nr:acyl carrier protein [Acidobacteriota bacterium]
MRQSRISEILAEIAGKPINIGTNESLFESGLLDSFGLTDLVTKLEAEYGIRIPDGDLNPRKFESIDKIASYVDDRV